MYLPMPEYDDLAGQTITLLSYNDKIGASPDSYNDRFGFVNGESKTSAQVSLICLILAGVFGLLSLVLTVCYCKEKKKLDAESDSAIRA
jgi:preprotein translocase subunit SecG